MTPCETCGKWHDATFACPGRDVPRPFKLSSTDGDTPCESCGRRRPLVGVRFPQTDDEFHVCRQCAVVGIRTHGVTEVELRFPVNPPDGAA